MPHTTFIPVAIFDNITTGLAADIAKLQPDMVSGEIAPHQIAELLAGYGVMPEDVMRETINNMVETAAEQLEADIPSVIRPAV